MTYSAGNRPAGNLSFLTRNQPVLFQPNADYTWAWSLTQYFANPEFWSLTG